MKLTTKCVEWHELRVSIDNLLEPSSSSTCIMYVLGLYEPHTHGSFVQFNFPFCLAVRCISTNFKGCKILVENSWGVLGFELLKNDGL